MEELEEIKNWELLEATQDLKLLMSISSSKFQMEWI
jgi:hypothetical protein